MRLKDPYFLFLLLLWLPMIWVYIRRERQSQPALSFSAFASLKKAPQSRAGAMRHSLFIFRLLATGLLTVALARPQKGHTEQEITTHGVDIMLALDISTSMKGLDFKPKNRLHVAKETIRQFIEKREHDRIGLVVFAGRSFTKCPLTLDYAILTNFLEEVTFDEIEDGTAIGTALATAANRMKESTAKSKVIVLLTDGANNKGEITPLVAAEAAAKLDMKIYTIGVGKGGKVPYPFEYTDRWTGKKHTRVELVDLEIDEETLRRIARKTNAAFFRAHNAAELKDIYDQIDQLEKSEIKTKTYTTWSEFFFPWLLAGFIFCMLELVLANTRFRRIP